MLEEKNIYIPNLTHYTSKLLKKATQGLNNANIVSLLKK